METRNPQAWGFWALQHFSAKKTCLSNSHWDGDCQPKKKPILQHKLGIETKTCGDGILQMVGWIHRWRLSASHSESMLCANDLETSPNRTRNGPVFPGPHLTGVTCTEAAAQVEHLVVNCSSSAAPVGHFFGATCNNLIILEVKVLNNIKVVVAWEPKGHGFDVLYLQSLGSSNRWRWRAVTTKLVGEFPSAMHPAGSEMWPPGFWHIWIWSDGCLHASIHTP